MRSRFDLPAHLLEREQRKYLVKATEFDKRYNLIMPIDPDYDPQLCRDEFLRHLFSDLELPPYERLHLETSTESWLATFLPNRYVIQQTPVVVSTTRLTDRASELRENTSMQAFPASAYKLSVLSGRTDRYDELNESMKRSALYFMFSRVINRLKIMERVSLDWGKMELSSLPHMLFSWSLEAFFKRCMLPDPVYLDVLQLSHKDEVLDWAKFSRDIQEIISIYKYFYKETFLEKGCINMSVIVGDQEMLLQIGDQLAEALQTSKKNFNSIAQSRGKVVGALWDHHRTKLVKDCKKRAMTATVLLPIQWRYIRNYYATLTEMQMMKDSQEVENLRKQIDALKKQLREDQVSANQAILAYSLVIENYQARVSHFSNKLSTECARYDDENLMASLRLGKSLDDYKDIEAKIVYMQKRVEEVREQVASERQSQLDRMFGSRSSFRGSVGSKSVMPRRDSRQAKSIKKIKA